MWVVWVKVNTSSPDIWEKGTQVKNTWYYRMDGDRVDMPGDEELPILHHDTCIESCAVSPSLFFLLSVFFPLHGSSSSLWSFLLWILFPCILCIHAFAVYIFSSGHAVYVCMLVRLIGIVCVSVCVFVCAWWVGEWARASMLQRRRAPTHVFAWPLNNLMFYW